MAPPEFNAAGRHVRVLMVDDHPIVTNAVANLVSRDTEFDIQTASSGRQALALYNHLQPDVVLCDINLDPDMSGIELTQRLRQTDPDVRVCIFSSANDEASITAAIDAGAIGYVTKGTDPAQLIEYLRAAAKGQQVYDPQVAQTVVEVLRRGGVEPAPLLNPREMEVLELLCSEVVSTSDIARRLHISPHTAKTHLDRLYSKLGVTSKTAAVARAFRTGLVRPADR